MIALALLASLPLALTATGGATAAEPVTHLSDLDPVRDDNGWGQVEEDRSSGERAAGDGRRLSIGGAGFDRGLGVHASSVLEYRVPSGCTRFQAQVGVDDEVGNRGSVGFRVDVDGSRVWSSGVRRGADPAARVDVAVTAGAPLRLTVDDAGDGPAHDHADWADARLLCSGGAAAAAPSPASPVGLPGSWDPVFSDEFDGSRLDSEHWNDSEPWERAGYVSGGAGWVRVPTPPSNLSVGGGAVTLRQRREGGLPAGRMFSTAHINTRGKVTIPAGSSTYVEARIKAPSNAGSLPGFWLLGNGTTAEGKGWPITGEVDIVEFANNATEKAQPYLSVWYPRDVWTRPPGTHRNGVHSSPRETWRAYPELKNSWHVWGLYRTPREMQLRIDGRLITTMRPRDVIAGGVPLPPVLFQAAQHIRFSYGMGGHWAGAGLRPDQYEEGAFSVDYVKVWRQR